MGTLGIVQALLFFIQGEQNPVYIAMRRRTGTAPGFPEGQGQSCLFFALMFSLPVLAFLGGQFAIISRPALGALLLAVVGGMFSLSWVVPLAMLAGRGSAYERAKRTWDLLLVTPYPTRTILLASAAASVQPAWQIALGLPVVASLLGICAAPITIITSMQRGFSPIEGILFMVAGMVSIVAEREQEIALAVLIGLAAGLTSNSRQVASLMGLVGGLVFRLFQTLLTVSIIFLMAPPTSPDFALLNAASGSATLLAAVPGFASLGIVLGLVAAREGLIRLVFAWTVRRAREG